MAAFLLYEISYERYRYLNYEEIINSVYFINNF